MRLELTLPTLLWALLTISMPSYYSAPCPPPMRHSNLFSWPLALLEHLQQKTSLRVRSMRKVAAASTLLHLVLIIKHLSNQWQERRSQGRLPVVMVPRLPTPMYILQLPYRKLSLIMRALVLPCIHHGVNVG